MNKKLQYSLFVLIAAAMGGGSYYYFEVIKKEKPYKEKIDYGIFYQKNKDLFKKIGVEYLKNSVVLSPVVKEVDVRQTERYLKNPEYYDLLEREYGNLISQGYVAPSTVRFINDTIGHGLFAEADIEPGQMVGEYTGRIIDTANLKDSKYSWSYPVKYDRRGNSSPTSLDAYDAGNEMRFVNHDDKPNAVIQMVPQGGIWHALYVANQPIKKGEQILTSYGDRYWSGKRKGQKHSFVKEDGTQDIL